MSILPIIKFPHAILRTPAAEVKSVTDDLRALSQKMLATMQAARGVGLAAPQIGESLRLIVANAAPEEKENHFIILFNPQITTAAAAHTTRDEGCLSIPGITAAVRRPAVVTIVGLDDNGDKQTIEADGLLAACLQHEIDHLNGVLFVDHLSRLKREWLLKKYLKLQSRNK